MERGGGFHGYQRPHPHPTFGPGMQPPPPDATNNECLVREQDRFMPIANVIRIMRKSLPTHAKISDDAKETIQECVSEFISFITGEANDRCQREQRKTITAEDILWAMNKLGFDDYIEPLTIYLDRYRELEYGADRGSVRGGDPALIRRAVADAGSKPFGNVDAAFGPVFGMGDQLFGAASMAGFLKDPANAGPSRPVAAVAGFEPYAQYKQ